MLRTIPTLFRQAVDDALVAEAQERTNGRRLPINGAGAGGAVLVDLGVPPDSVRGFVAQLAGKARHPIGRPLWLEVEEHARPRDGP